MFADLSKALAGRKRVVESSSATTVGEGSNSAAGWASGGAFPLRACEWGGARGCGASSIARVAVFVPFSDLQRPASLGSQIRELRATLTHYYKSYSTLGTFGALSSNGAFKPAATAQAA